MDGRKRTPILGVQDVYIENESGRFLISHKMETYKSFAPSVSWCQKSRGGEEEVKRYTSNVLVTNLLLHQFHGIKCRGDLTYCNPPPP